MVTKRKLSPKPAKKKKSELLTMNELATRVGCHPSAVDKACRQGRIPRERGGKINWYRKEVQEFDKGYKARKAQRAAAQARGKAAAKARKAGELRYATKQEAEIARLNEQVIKFQLGNRAREGELVERALVLTYFQKWFSVYQTELYTLGDRVAPEIVSITGAMQADAGVRIAAAVRDEAMRSVEHMKMLLAETVNGLRFSTATETGKEERDEDGNRTR